MANFIDRAVGYFSPQRGFKRLAARAAMQSLGYDGAKPNRRHDGWLTGGTSADAEVQSAAVALRQRSRDLVRNNPHAARAIEVKVSTTIGHGITAKVKGKKLASVWDAFVDNCDADNHLDLHGIQGLFERCRSESGEALIQRAPSRLVRGGIATRLRVLEPDHLDTSRDTTTGTTSGYIRQGIEYDAMGVAVAYWIYPEHPGNSSLTGTFGRNGMESKRIPASDIIHGFRKLRPGQTRGVTDFAPVIMRLRGLDDYDDAELMRKKIEACLAIFVQTNADFGGAGLGSLTTDTKGRLEALFPGMIGYLNAGESAIMADPKASGGYADFERFGLRAIASGYGVPAFLMTGDLADVNYSTARVELVDFRRRIEADQWLVHIPQVWNRVWGWFLEDATNIHNTNPRATVEWGPPRFEMVDPDKETSADLESVLAGFETWDDVVSRRGWNADEQLEKIEKWQKSLSDRGIIIKSNAALPAPKPPQPAAPPAPPPGDDDGNDDEQEAA